jgi:hypothetical protein
MGGKKMFLSPIFFPPIFFRTFLYAPTGNFLAQRSRNAEHSC